MILFVCHSVCGLYTFHLCFERHCHLDRLAMSRTQKVERSEKEGEAGGDEGRSGSLSVTRIEACY